MSESSERVVIYRCAGDAINEDAHTKSSAVLSHNMYLESTIAFIFISSLGLHTYKKERVAMFYYLFLEYMY